MLMLSHLSRLRFAGLAAGLSAVSAELLLRHGTGIAIFAEIATDAVAYILRPRGFSYFLDRLGAEGKPLFFLSILSAQILAYVLLETALRPLLPSVGRGWAARAAAVGIRLALATTAYTAFTLLLILVTPADLPSGSAWTQYLLQAATVAALYAGIAEWSRGPSQPRVKFAGVDRSRRRVIMGAPGLILALGSFAVIGKEVWERRRAAPGLLSGQRTPEITPTADFYVVSKNLFDPHVDIARWSLRIGQMRLTDADMRALPAKEQIATMQCISNEVGGRLISTARWTGTPLREVLDRAGVPPTARYVVFTCADGYVESLPLDYALQPQVLLAYDMNGAPLTAEHGAPLRLIAPGKYGIKHPKWITAITFSEQEVAGYWAERGWTREARMKTSTRIDLPGDGSVLAPGLIEVSGIAFTGDRGVRQVEVSLDSGATWQSATVKPPLSPYSWVLWRLDSRIDREGGTDLVARTTDGGGDLQPSERKNPAPDGAQGGPKKYLFIQRR